MHESRPLGMRQGVYLQRYNKALTIGRVNPVEEHPIITYPVLISSIVCFWGPLLLLKLITPGPYLTQVVKTQVGKNKQLSH